MSRRKIWLGPGSREASGMVGLMTALCPPGTEIIDLSQARGQTRIAEINRGLADGTLDFRMPPLVFMLEGHPEPFIPRMTGHGPKEAQ